jgi:hypothetical protein
VSLEKIRANDWVVGGLALLAVIDLAAFPWFSFPGASITFSGTTLAYGVGGPLAATDQPDGWLGILAAIALLAVATDLALKHISPDTNVPAIRGSRTLTHLVLVIAAAVLLALKFLLHITSAGNLGFGFWAALVLMTALVFFTREAHSAALIKRRREAELSGPAHAPPREPAGEHAAGASPDRTAET